MKLLVPLPEIDPLEHYIDFNGLALPQGFKEEKLLIDVERLRLLREVAGLGQISVIGVAGEKLEYNAQISGVNENGEASLGLGVFRRKKPIVNGVTITESGKYDRLLYEPDVKILMNVRERDARIDEIDSPRRHFDPEGHAKLLNNALKKGIAEAAKQRYDASTIDLQKVVTVGALALNGGNDVADIISRHPEAAISTILMVSFWAGFDVLYAKMRNLSSEEAKISFAFGLDRFLGSAALAKISNIVTAES